MIKLMITSQNDTLGFLQTPLGIFIITFVAGALSGTVNYLLQKRAQHGTWLLEKRITAFTEFLKIFEQSRANSTSLLREIKIGDKSKIDKIIINEDGLIVNIFEIYEPTINNSRIVRLLLNEKLRKQFSDLVNRHIEIHATANVPDKEKAREEIISCRNQIQTLLEKHLKNRLL